VIVYYCAATLDGFVAEPDDTIEWLTAYEGSYAGADARPIDGSYESFYRDVGALVCGSATYEFVLGSLAQGGRWPYPGKPCWVLTSRRLPLPPVDGADVRFACGAVAGLVEVMVASAGGSVLWVVGGGNVASQFADLGLLDELCVHVVPVVLARGKPLFERPLRGGPLRLLAATPRDNGMVELRYALGSEGSGSSAFQKKVVSQMPPSG
jgi:dihydrofolate reductase